MRTLIHAAAMLVLAVPAFSQTTSTVQAPVMPTTTAAAPTTGAKPLGKQIVLAGETPRWEVDAGRAATKPIAPIATEVFGDSVTDLTTTGELVADSIKKAEETLAGKPDIVIVFTGKADEAAKMDDETHMKAVSELARALSAGGAAVYVVPSDPSMGAATVASLRIGSNLAGVEFIEAGTEIGGHPYKDAFAAIRKIQTQPGGTAGAAVPIALDSTATIVIPGDITPPPGQRSVTVDQSQTSAIIRMKPPAPLRQFDPASQAGSKPPRIKKRPATAK